MRLREEVWIGLGSYPFCLRSMSQLGHSRRFPDVRHMSGHRGWSQPVDATLYLTGGVECAVMGDKFHRGVTAEEKRALWDRWNRGEALKAHYRALGETT